MYDEDASFLAAIAIDEATGKIATCTERNVRIYKPYGQNEGALKVSRYLPSRMELSDVLLVVASSLHPYQQLRRTSDYTFLGWHGRATCGKLGSFVIFD